MGLPDGEQRHAVTGGVEQVVEIHARSTDDAGHSYDDARPRPAAICPTASPVIFSRSPCAR
jgi:hypothetical protein